MDFNYGLEKKNFDRQWAIMRKQYEDAGMSIEVIQAMYSVVQRGVFGLKIGRNGTNYREPAFQIVGISAVSHIAADDVASKKLSPPCD